MNGPLVSSGDLVVLVPDMDIDFVLGELLKRASSLTKSPLRFSIHRHPQRDPGCARRSVEFLRPFLNHYQYALVCFDHEGSGMEPKGASEVSDLIRNRLERNGWKNRCEVLVFEPEIESWMLVESPVVPQAIGWHGSFDDLREWLKRHGMWDAIEHKPSRPKEALELALRRTRKRRSSTIYAQVAREATVSRCSDLEFSKFLHAIRNWFGIESESWLSA